MAKKIGFALGAGGSRGVAHIGFLKAMEEMGITPDFVTGSSMGAVVGACYAIGLSPDKMIDEVLKLRFSDIFDLSLNPIGSGALLRAKRTVLLSDSTAAALQAQCLQFPTLRATSEAMCRKVLWKFPSMQRVSLMLPAQWARMAFSP